MILLAIILYAVPTQLLNSMLCAEKWDFTKARKQLFAHRANQHRFELADENQQQLPVQQGVPVEEPEPTDEEPKIFVKQEQLPKKLAETEFIHTYNRATGVVIGAAAGDALGRKTEFAFTVKDLTKLFPSSVDVTLARYLKEHSKRGVNVQKKTDHLYR